MNQMAKKNEIHNKKEINKLQTFDFFLLFFSLDAKKKKLPEKIERRKCFHVPENMFVVRPERVIFRLCLNFPTTTNFSVLPVISYLENYS